MADIGSCVTSMGLWPVVAVVLGLLYHAVQHVKRLKAELDYTKKSAKRREHIDAKKAEAREAADAEVAEAREAAAAAREGVAAEEAVVATTKKKSGAAKAASEHVKRLRGLVAFIICAFAASTVRAAPCPEGRTVMAGEVIDCDAECLPEADLLFLLDRSLALSRLTVDYAEAEAVHAAHTRELTTNLVTLRAAYDEQEASCASALKDCASATTATETYILAAVGVFILGVGVGLGLASAIK